jgi:hypothetical protein
MNYLVYWYTTVFMFIFTEADVSVLRHILKIGYSFYPLYFSGMGFIENCRKKYNKQSFTGIKLKMVHYFY